MPDATDGAAAPVTRSTGVLAEEDGFTPATVWVMESIRLDLG